MIREILKRRDEKSVELMDLRNKMDEEPQEFKSDEQLNYEARNSAAAYDMNIYHMLASKAQSNVENFFIGNTINNRKRDKKTAAAVRKAYALMRDRAYNKINHEFCAKCSEAYIKTCSVSINTKSR